MEVISDMGAKWWDDKYGRESCSATKKKILSWEQLNFLGKVMRPLFKVISDLWKENGCT